MSTDFTSPQQPQYGQPRKRWVLPVSIVTAIAVLLGGGYAYGQYAYQPEKTLGQSMEQIKELKYFEYSFGSELTFDVDDAPSFDLFAPEPETKASGSHRLELNIVSRGTMDLEKDISRQETDVSLSGIDDQVMTLETTAVSLADRAYVRLDKLPGFFSLFAGPIVGEWIMFDLSGFTESEQISEMSGKLSEIRDEDLEELKDKKEEIQAVLSNKDNYEIIKSPAWYDVLLKRGEMHYQVVMTQENLKNVFRELSAIVDDTAASSAVDLTETEDFLGRIDRVEAEFWINSDNGYLEKIYMDIIPSASSNEEEDLRIVKLDMLLELTPLDQAPVIDMPDEYMAMEELLEKMLGGLFAGITDEMAPDLPDGVSDIDTDGDGLSDQEELLKYGIDHTKADTDGDGYSDGEEVANGFNPVGEGESNQDIFDIFAPARTKSRDAKRLADMRQIQTALELRFVDGSGYAEGENLALGDDVTCLDSSGWSTNCAGSPQIYMGFVPSDPLHDERKLELCNKASTEPCDYTYNLLTTDAYEMLFFLEGEAGGLEAGLACATPNGISSGVCP